MKYTNRHDRVAIIIMHLMKNKEHGLSINEIHQLSGLEKRVTTEKLMDRLRSSGYIPISSIVATSGDLGYRIVDKKDYTIGGQQIAGIVTYRWMCGMQHTAEEISDEFNIGITFARSIIEEIKKIVT